MTTPISDPNLGEPNWGPHLNARLDYIESEAAVLFRAGLVLAAGAAVVNPNGELVTSLAAQTTGTPYDATKFSAPASATYAAKATTALATQGFYVPAGWGSVWRPNLLAGTARCALVGHSVGAGYFSSSLRNKGYAGLLRIALQAQAGDGGSGFQGVVDAKGAGVTDGAGASQSAITGIYPNAEMVVATGTWSHYNGSASTTQAQQQTGTTSVGASHGPGADLLTNGDLQALGPYAAGSLTWQVRGRRVRVYYPQASQPFTVTIDGGSAQTVNPTGSTTTGPGVALFDATGTGTHSVVLTTVNTTNWTGFYGVSAHNDTGISLDNFSRQGYASGAFAPTVTPNLGGAGAAPALWSGGPSYPYPADLLIYSHDANDTANGVSADTLASNMRTVLDANRNVAGGGPDILLVLNHAGTFDNTNKLWHRYAREYRTMAEAYGAALIDLWAVGKNSWAYWNGLGYWSTGAGASGSAGTDAVHPSDAGHLFIKNTLAPLVLATS